MSTAPPRPPGETSAALSMAKAFISTMLSPVRKACDTTFVPVPDSATRPGFSKPATTRATPLIKGGVLRCGCNNVAQHLLQLLHVAHEVYVLVSRPTFEVL